MGQTAMFVTILALSFISIVSAFDSSPLQDFCVADKRSSWVRMDGLQCKDPASVTVDDFFYSGLHLPSNTTSQTGAGYNTVSVKQVPGLNTLGLFLGRLDLKPDGYVSPHFHPRGTEVVVVLEGSMEMGFVTSYPDYRHIKKVLVKGDFFAVPVGLIHYARNVGPQNAVALWAINSQNPGTTTVTGGVFAAKPPIDSAYLSKAFLVDNKTVEGLQTKFNNTL